ncbi:MAG: DUF3179 domain-containing protein [Gammaproteobacteria bacterium]
MRVRILWLVCGLLAGASAASAASAEDELVVSSFMQLLLGDATAAEQAFEFIEEEWVPGFVPMSLEALYLATSTARSAQLVSLLEAKTQQQLGFDISAWYEWLWNQPDTSHPAYGDFKSALYSRIDPVFAGYFSSEREMDIRLDEIRWGGVRQDGIPPLRSPRMVSAADADYLADDNIVFGLEVNGDARAYPKRILAWHELFIDEVGGVPVAGVYCTLCGSMILYNTEYDGINHALGTSGFLYRSNKLMYDQATQSLWSTLWGTPVVGPLVGRGIELERTSVVTTTWGAWRERHPDTVVLSLDTGYRRDYSEGAAYRDYFATDELMFNVPTLDRRLKNKDEVLGLLMAGTDSTPIAFASDFLQENSLYHDNVSDRDIVILTDRSGAHRVYEANGVMFADWDEFASVVDVDGVRWTLNEVRLESAEGRIRYRLPAHRAFWFGWYSAYPQTRLIH